MLANPVWTALTATQAPFGRRLGGAACFAPEVSVFAGLADNSDPQSWPDLATVVEPDTVVVLVGADTAPPAGWTVEARIDGAQMNGAGLQVAPDPEARPLGPDDVPAMIDLVERTKPGPFAPRTVELGGYLGIYRDGKLVAMAGERFRPPGWAEISAVCTDPDYRGLGLAYRLMRAVGAGIRERGDVPFLHVAGFNTNAIALYERMGFTLQRNTAFVAVRSPAAAGM